MLRERLIIGLLGAAVAIAILLSNEIVLGAVVTVVALIGLTEMYNAFGFFKKNIPLAVLGYIAGSAILILNNYAGCRDYSLFTSFCLEVIIVFMLVLFVYMVLSHKRTSFADVTVCLFSTMYVALFFSCLILIRYQPNGKYLIWIPIIIAWLSDTMAYTFGRLFGKHKLIPEVSPKKTVEGAVGGVIGGVVFMLIYSIVCVYWFDKSVNWMNIILLGGVGSVISQFGDLAASWIKREQGIKDYGSILPGHGGVIDRFDSVLAVAPFVFYSLIILPVFK